MSSGLRAQHRAATEERILDAVQEVLVDEHPSALSMPSVARRAGVSLRTLYRYFPTKEALVDAASHTFADTRDPEWGDAITPDTLAPHLAALWRRFASNLPAVIAQHTTPAGRDLRRARLGRFRGGLERQLAGLLPDLPADDRARLVDAALAMSSSAMFLELTQHHGHDTDDAARLASWLVDAAIEKARNEGGVAR